MTGPAPAAQRDPEHLGGLISCLLMFGMFVATPLWAGPSPMAVGFSIAMGLLFLIVLALGLANIRRVRAAARGEFAVRPVRVVRPPARRPVARPESGWTSARQRFHRLRDQYALFECDPMAVLRLPALADVTVASTARFVDAFAEAQALETDRFPGSERAPEFLAAVDRAERAWRAARDAAERIRLSGLTPAERATVERVIKLLTTARDSDSEPERLAAYTRARTELARLDRSGVIQVPLPAQAALDEAARGQLPGRT
jgi:hypothetical protein